MLLKSPTFIDKKSDFYRQKVGLFIEESPTFCLGRSDPLREEGKTFLPKEEMRL